MKLEKLWKSLAKMDKEYFFLLDEVMSNTTQEIMDSDKYADEGMVFMPSIAVFGEIENILGPEATSMAHTCILEFCITNEYITKQVTWNCINHLLTRHDNLFTFNEKEYLKALNNSHMSIYEVISTDKAKGVSVIHDQIESAAGKVEVFDKSLSKNTRPGQLIAVRLIKIHDKSGQEKYILSASILILPKKAAKAAINSIKMIPEVMNHKLMASMITPEVIEDTKHNRLMIKKMWAKEIMESWYLYFANYRDHKEFLDYEGNPYKPCTIEFDVNVSNTKISDALDKLPDFVRDGTTRKSNAWVWLEKSEGSNDLKPKVANDDIDEDEKEPLYFATMIQNLDKNLFYHVLASVSLQKKKLIAKVNSVQRANIASDFIMTRPLSKLMILAPSYKFQLLS